MHPNGQLPAYEWAFGDVNPPVHAWAALRVFEIDAPPPARPTTFLERIFHKLLLNFTWWVNRKDADGNNVFEGGFLGLDNIGPIDRSAPLPVDGPPRAVRRHRLDGACTASTCWRSRSSWPSTIAGLRGHGHEVLRALRLHRHRHPRPRPVGRRGRLLLRRAAHRRRRAHARCGCARWSGCCRCAPRPRSARRRSTGCPTSPATSAGSSSNKPQFAAPHRPPPRPRRQRGPAARRSSARSASSASSPRCSTRTSSCRRTACGRVSATPPRRAVHASSSAACSCSVDYEPGRAHDRAVRRQLQLAGPGVVPGQLPRRRGAAPLTAASSATTSPSSTRPAPGRRLTLDRGRRRPRRPPGRHLPRRRRRPPAGASAPYERFQTDPAWHDADPVPRVLPRRHRRRPRRLPPDRLDRPRRRPAAAGGA